MDKKPTHFISLLKKLIIFETEKKQTKIENLFYFYFFEKKMKKITVMLMIPGKQQHQHKNKNSATS